MPVIKQYTRQTQSRELINVQAGAAAFGGNVAGLEAQARSSQQLANSLKDLQTSVETVIQKREESDYYAKISEFELQNMQRQQELSTAEFEDETQIAASYQRDLEDRAARLDIPRSMQDRFQRDLANMRVNFVRNGMQEQARRAGERAKLNYENTLTNVTNMITLDPSRFEEGASILAGQINSLNVAGIDKEVMIDQMRDSLKTASLNSVAQKNPYQFLKDARSGAYNDVEGLDTLMGIADRRIKEINAEANRQANEIKGIEESRLDLALAQSISTADLVSVSQQIDSLEKRYGEKWANDYRVKLVNANSKWEKNNSSLQLGGDIVNGGVAGNPKIKEHRDAVDVYYNSFKENPQFKQATPEQQNYMITQLVTKAKIVPETLKGEIEVAVRSKNGEQLQSITNLIDNIKTQNPYMLDALGNTSRLEAINAEVDAGVPMAQAIQVVDERMNPANAPREEAIREELSKIKIKPREKTVEAFRTWGDWAGGFFGSGIDATTPQAQTELDYASAVYRDEFEKAYRKTRNEDAAHSIARTQMANYGRTEVNGSPMITRFPPEKYYNIENRNNAEWIRRQATEDAKDFLSSGMSVPRTTEEIEKNIRIIPHPTVTKETAKTGRPVYILGLEQDGQIINVLGEGKYWQPDEQRERDNLAAGIKPPIQSQGELGALMEALSR